MSYIAALAVPHGGIIVGEPTMPRLIERIARHIGRDAQCGDPLLLAANIGILANANLGRGTWDADRINFSVAA